jgi:hypothetical protein
MNLLRLASLLILLLTLTAYALPAPHPESIAPQPTLNGELARATLLRYRWLRDTELPEMLAWLRDRGPFTRPRPDLLPEGATVATQ